MATMSDTTALAVLSPPAPRPLSRTRPARSELISTALSASSTPWRGWPARTTVGRTQSVAFSSLRWAPATSLTLPPRSAAPAMSAAATWRIPTRSTSPTVSGASNASRLSSTSLAAASWPSTSAEGSASAKPRSWASRTAVSSDTPLLSMRVRMTLVVPLMIISSPPMRSPRRLSRSSATTGNPAPTAAS